MTVRERSHIYHEESLKLSIKKNGSTNVFHLMTELPEDEQKVSPESSKRNVVSFENNGLYFEVDFTDLETFGETAPVKTPKMQKTQTEQDACVLRKKASCSPSLSKTKEMDTLLTDLEDPITEETTQPVLNEENVPKTEQMGTDSAQDSGEELPFIVDSDEEKLVIDDCVSPAKTPTKQHKPKTILKSPITPVSPSAPVNSESSSPQKVTKQRRQSKKTNSSGDQLGEILRMQTAMFNSANDTAPCSAISQETNSPTRGMGPSLHSHPMSLVKACVSSYLERKQNHDEETCAVSHESAPVVNVTATEHKKILSQDLQAGAEDEHDYKAPEEGNLLYKLYSLQDLLLMVCSSVSLTHTRKVGQKSQNQYVPVHVLPKLEYQLSYGVECLSSSEACQLWTETLLHSSTVSYIAHINAHTSKVAVLRKLPDNWKQNISCGFKPSNSLNILQHLLKKLTGLEEGRYLIVHKAGEPFVTLLKAANGKVSRGAYNLQQVHSSVPTLPGPGLVPWIPVDPTVVLPFHQKHGRVPCTFPPTPFIKTTKGGSLQSNNHGAGQSKNNFSAGGNTKKKKKKRAARRNKKVESPQPFHLNIAWTYLCISTLFVTFTRTVKMAMVSEFLGQLSLNIGANEPTYPTVVPAKDFDPDRDAARIETAIKTKGKMHFVFLIRTLGVDEQTIIDVLTKRTYSQRREIAFAYERRTKKGAGTDEETLIEVLCSRSNDELVEIKKVYKELFKKELEKDVAGDTSGNFAKLLLALVQTKRADPTAIVDYDKIDADARALFEAGVMIKGTDVPTWISIMSERSVPHLQKVFQRYKSYSPYDMQESIMKEVKGDLQKSFLVLVKCFENKQLFFASQLNQAMKSKGAKEKIVTRIVVSRCEVDLKKICSEYKANFGESLQKTIMEHTKGDYQKALLSLCGPEE
ncbi:hypothetical protein FQN60_014032 [Etheostoma spectabile]|uniref:Annexin n=1 Tax=Etheostoma spectabile TaxID=54343 RepID=A0A5J5D5U2_9PERO|nr:hypothetical protein FQN60_014032 [Etheostoma spectabile]